MRVSLSARFARRWTMLGTRFKWLLFVFFVSACASSIELPNRVQADIAWVAEGGFCEPETVLPLPDRTLLVSNVCGFSSMEDGYLSLLDANGHVIDWRIVDALNSPLGMALSDGRIYVVDANTIRSFAWPGFKALDQIELDTQVANDVAVSPNGNLYISDTAKGRVVVLEPNGKQTALASDTRFEGANGMEIGPDGALYVGGTSFWRVDLDTGGTERLGPDWLTDIDGIEFELDGTTQVTPVGGPLIRLRKDGQVDVIGSDQISSANHGYSVDAKLALIPTGFDNSVIAIRTVEGASKR